MHKPKDPFPQGCTKYDLLDAEVILPICGDASQVDLASLVQVMVREPYQTEGRLLVVDVSRLRAT